MDMEKKEIVSIAMMSRGGGNENYTCCIESYTCCINRVHSWGAWGLGIAALLYSPKTASSYYSELSQSQIKENLRRGAISELNKVNNVFSALLGNITHKSLEALADNKQTLNTTVTLGVIGNKVFLKEQSTPIAVDVVRARPENVKGLYSFRLPTETGERQLYVGNLASLSGKPSKSPSKGYETSNTVKKPLLLAGRPVIVVFPESDKISPIYVAGINHHTSEAKQKEKKKVAPLVAAKQELTAATQEYAAALKQVETKAAQRKRIDATPEARLLHNPAQFPLNVTLNNGRVRFSHKIDSNVALSFLYDRGAKRYVMEHLGYANSGETQGVKEALVAVFESIKQRLFTAKKATKDAANELALAQENKKKAKERKSKAEEKVKEEKNKKRKGVKEKGHDYHPAPETEEIKGLGELKKGKKKTPKQGGGGMRARWVGDKGRKIYEWDSQHGELEGYRGSDGQHIGVFDPKTGKQLKPADPKRNIKKYL